MTEVSQRQKPCIGEFTKQLDEKRRLTIPAKWRFDGDNADDAYIAIATNYGSIEVLPPARAQALMENISRTREAEKNMTRPPNGIHMDQMPMAMGIIWRGMNWPIAEGALTATRAKPTPCTMRLKRKNTYESAIIESTTPISIRNIPMKATRFTP